MNQGSPGQFSVTLSIVIRSCTSIGTKSNIKFHLITAKVKYNSIAIAKIGMSQYFLTWGYIGDFTSEKF